MIARRFKRVVAGDEGFALISVMLLLLVGSLFAAAAYSSANSDIKPSARDRDRKVAFSAAEAGLNFYLFHLNQDTAYWSKCANVGIVAPQENPVNQPRTGPSSNGLSWRKVPGSKSKYAIEVIPQNGATSCVEGFAGLTSMVDSATGTLAIRSTGDANGIKRSVVARLRRRAFLDFLYFTDYETPDPVTYSTPALRASAASLCNTYRRTPRDAMCGDIVFADADQIRGPFHTNDSIVACGTPEFGRNSTDNVEISGPAPGYQAGCGGSASPVWNGTLKTGADTMTMPTTNSELTSLAAPAYTFTGQTTIELKGSSMDVTNAAAGYNTPQNMPLPANGVIYVKNSSCSVVYDLMEDYERPAGCGDLYVKGNYSASLTMAAQNDIVVNGNLTRNGNTVLGLIPNNFARVYHPVTTRQMSGGAPVYAGTCTTNASASPAPLGSIQIDAAILSLQHSFIVDNYYCGGPLGTLTVNGAIAQRFRGPVGRGGATITSGYVKNYVYDDRLKVLNPPFFINPVQSAWRVMRYNEEVPAR